MKLRCAPARANARRRAHAHTHASPPPQPTWTDGTTLIFDPEPGDVTGEVVFTVKVPRPTPNFHTHRTPGTRTPPCGSKGVFWLQRCFFGSKELNSRPARPGHTHTALRLQICVLAPKVFFGSKELNSRPARPGHTHTLQLQINLQI